MKLYAFDGVDENLELLPISARRALDFAGIHLSLAGFLALSLDTRRALAETGEAAAPSRDLISSLIEGESPLPRRESPTPEPSSEEPPPALLSRLGPTEPLTNKVWQALTPLDRYALVKAGESKSPERVHAAYAEIVGCTAVSTHLRPEGGVRMVDVTSKPPTKRRAVAESWVNMNSEAFSLLVERRAPKGDVLATARVAGILAMKQTSQLIPLCHPLGLGHAEIEFEEDARGARLGIRSTAEVFGPTGVEMEAMAGASIAALTVYDMLKAVDRSMTIGPTHLVEKSGGRSGDFVRPSQKDSD